MDMTFLRAGVLSVLFMLTACDAQKAPVKTDNAAAATVLEGKTMGTFWRVSVMNIDPARAEELRGKIQTQLDADDQLLSTYKNDSALMRFNHSKSTSPWPVSDAMADIVTEALRVGYKTRGAMDITVGPLVNLWGFGPNKQPVKTPTQAQIDDARAQTGLHHLTVLYQYGQQYLEKNIPDLFVDLSTVGEGYAADHLAALMAEEGIFSAIVRVL
jgi:thiamine biosynthesis lipoprotein